MRPVSELCSSKLFSISSIFLLFLDKSRHVDPSARYISTFKLELVEVFKDSLLL